MSGESWWRVDITRRAKQDLKRLDPPVRERVREAIDGLEGESPSGDVKRLTGRNPPQWRLRVGDWRVIYTSEERIRVITVVRVLPRGRAYRD